MFVGAYPVGWNLGRRNRVIFHDPEFVVINIGSQALSPSSLKISVDLFSNYQLRGRARLFSCLDMMHVSLLFRVIFGI